MALRWGLELAKSINLSKVVFQSDAFTVVYGVNGFTRCAAIEPVIEDCKTLLSDFTVSIVIFIGRNRNIKVHSSNHFDFVVGSKILLGFIFTFVVPFSVTSH